MSEFLSTAGEFIFSPVFGSFGFLAVGEYLEGSKPSSFISTESDNRNSLLLYLIPSKVFRHSLEHCLLLLLSNDL